MNLKKIVAVALTIFTFFTVGGTNIEAIDSFSTHVKNGKIVTNGNFEEQDDYKKIKPFNEKYNEYLNYAHGYAVKVNSDMFLDVTLSAVKSRFYNKNREIEIYYDNFEDTVHSAHSYINYSNKFLDNTKDHYKEYEEVFRNKGMTVHVLKWSRDKLPKVKDDKNYYVSAEIIKNQEEVYTIFIKSSTPFSSYEDYMDIIKSFRLIEKKGTAKINTKFYPVSRQWNEETQELYQKYFVKSDKLYWGIFENSVPRRFDFLSTLEDRINYTLPFVVRYQAFSDGNFPMEDMKNAYKHNRVVELTLQTMNMGEDNSSITYDILNGEYDEYFQEYAKKAKEFGHPILFRLNNEMNGDWCVYSSYYSSKDTQLYKEVWKYVYGIFEENGVDNVLWVWNPHDISFPNFGWNHYLNYYPGDEYVDIIGMTGYNTGTYYNGEIWRGFTEIYDPLYEEYDKLFKQPLMITEFGSNSVGGDKITWINEMFDNMKRYDRIKVAIWWNGIDWDTNKNPARIYRLDQSEEMLDAFKERLTEYK